MLNLIFVFGVFINPDYLVSLDNNTHQLGANCRATFVGDRRAYIDFSESCQEVYQEMRKQVALKNKIGGK